MNNIGGSTQSLNYNSFETIYAYFLNSNDEYVDVTSPTITITQDNGDITKVDGESITKVATGKYSYALNLNDWDTGLYQVVYNGTYNSEAIRVSGQINIGPVSNTQYYIRAIRFKLKDFLRKISGSMLLQYQIDSDEFYKWSENEIYASIEKTLNIINVTPPQRTSWTIDNVPVSGLLIDGVFIDLVESQALLEIFNTLEDRDAKLTINRGPQLSSMADRLKKNWLEQIKGYKQSNPPTPIGSGNSRLPFRVLRPLAMISGMQNSFRI